MESEDETTLRKRISELELACTEHGLSLGDTITARTLAAAPPTDTLKDEAGHLPHLTLETSAAANSNSELAVVELIGEGGMGRVYLAHQRSMRRDVAVKTLKPNASSDVARSLLREARMTGMLEHPGVIPVHALGVDDANNPILVMKRIAGVTLAERIAKEGPLAGAADRVANGIETLVKVCHTIELAHSRGVIHRDIKPENIMLGSFGEVYLVDWGIAILKVEPNDGSIVGTPLYMAPEMVRGRDVDERTDVYLLGATLHEMLTGRPRHEGETLLEITRAAMISAPYAYGEDVPEALARLCNRATARNPDERPKSATELREALTAFLRHQSAETLARSAAERVTQLEALVAATIAPLDIALAYRLAAEARFGLTESLRQDPLGAVAQGGMRRLRRAAVDIELRQDHLESAEALLAEIDAPDEELLQRVEACRVRLARQRSEHVRLQRIARDADPTIGAKKRTRQIVAVALATTLAGVIVWLVDVAVTATSILVVGALIFGMLLGSVVVARKTVMTSAFNARVAGMSVLALAAVVLNRVAGLLAGRPPDETLRHDLFILGVLVAAGAITFFRPIWRCLPILAAAYFGALRWPEHAVRFFIVSTIAILLIAALLLARTRRDDAT